MNPALDRINYLVKALQPVLGHRAKTYKELWLVSDRKGKEEVEQLLQIEFSKHFPGEEEKVFPPPSTRTLL